VIKRRVIVVGDVMLDVVVKPHRAIAPTSDTPSNIRISRGGSAANMAVALSQAGHDVTFVGAAGDDAAAQFFADDLTSAGVHAKLQIGTSSTGVVVALVGDDGQRAMLTDRGANSILSTEHVLLALDEPFDHLHVSGYSLLDGRTRVVGVAALDKARALGRTTSVDVCSVAPLRDVTPELFMNTADNVTCLFANEEEAQVLAHTTSTDEAVVLLASRFNEVVVTRGAGGAVARKDGVTFRATSSSDAVVDTTGAGDAATGAYLAVRLGDGSIDEGLAAAMEAASVVVRGLGSRG
jgi:ribokinase